MAEITGGQLNFELQVDPDELKKGLTDAEGKLMGFGEFAEKTGEKLDSALKGSAINSLKELSKEATKTGSSLKSASDVKIDFGLTKENLAIQKSVINDIKKNIDEIEKRAKAMAPGMAQASVLGELKPLKEELAAEEKALSLLEVEMKKTAVAATTLSSKYLEAKNRLAELTLANKQGTPEYTKAEAEVKKYGTALSDTNARAKALTAGTIGGLAQGLSLITGTMATGTALLGVFGSKNEDLNQIMIKTQALLTATVTLQEIKNTTMQKGGVISGIMAIQEMARSRATALATANTIRATIAQRALNIVANANPYILLATAILTVVGALAIYSINAKKASNTQKELNDAIKAGTGETAKEIISLERVYKTATNDKLSKEQRLKAVKDLKKEFPGLFGQINNEIILNGQAANSYLAVRDAILKSARAKAASSIIEKKTEDLLLSQEEAKLKVAEKLSRIIKLEAAKKSGAKTMRVDYNDIGNDYSGNVNIDEQLKIEKSGLNFLLRGVTKVTQDFKRANNGLIKIMEDGQTAMFEATNAPIVKGTDSYWQSEIDRLEELKSRTQTGSKAWKEYGNQIKAIQDKINPPKEKADKKDPIGKQIAEILPKESIAELQQRVSLYDDAINKAVNGEVKLRSLDKYGKDKDRNGNPFFTGEVATVKDVAQRKFDIEQQIAELQKAAQIKNLQERSADQQKYGEAYLIIAEKYGKEEAEKMYGPLMEGTKSYYEWLNKQKSLLEAKGGILTEKDKTDLVFFITQISELEGKKNAFQNFSDGIDEALAKIPTLSEQIEFLKNKQEERKIENSKTYEDGEQKFLQEQADQRLQQVRENYQNILDEQRTYEEKSIILSKEYASIKASEQYKKSTPKEQKKIDKSFTEKQGVLDIDMIQKTAEWQVAFGELEGMTNTSLQLILQRLLDFQSKSKGTLSIQDASELQKAIDNVRNAANNNPFAFLTTSFSDYRNSLKESKTAQEEYNQVLAETPNDAEKVAKAGEKMVLADKKHLEAKKKLIAGIQKGQEVFNAVGEGVLELGDAFGGMSDATKDAIGDIMDIGNAAMDFATSLASGDVAGMIKAGIKLITGVFKALNGDKKKEREIKKQQEAINSLELAYNDLAFAAERAFGAQKYSGQTDLIRNLEQQKIAIEGMMRTEQSKKKADGEKISDYQQHIQTINQSIASIKEGIIKDVLQTDVVDAAGKIGDALVDAFGRGEDAAKALENVANDMIKNLLKNQLNLMLQNRMKPILDNLLAQAGFNQDGTGVFTGLTPEQIAAFKAQVAAAGESMNGFLEAYGDIFAGIDGNQEGMKGDIKGITEKTAGALEAQINVMRQYQAEALALSRNNHQIFISSLQNLVLIEFNTRNLIQIRQDISEMNSKMSKGLAGL